MGVTSMGNKTFTLTANQDTINAKGDVIVNGPLVGGAPTLNNFDSIWMRQARRRSTSAILALVRS